MLKNPKLLAVATVFMWAIFAPVAKAISDRSQYLFVAGTFLCSFITFGGVGLLRWRRQKGQGFRGFKATYLFYGLFGFFFYYLGLNNCFREFPTAGGTVVLNYTWPIFTVIFSELIFRRTRKPVLYRLVEWTGIGIAFFAVYVLATKGQLGAVDFSRVAGLSWGLMAGASYGFFSAYSSTVPQSSQGLFLLISTFVSFFAMLPLAATETYLLSSMTFTDVLLMFTMGGVLNALGNFFWTSANIQAREKNIDISSVSSIIFFLPVISVILVSLIFREEELLKPYFAITILLLTGGSWLCQKTSWIVDLITGQRSTKPIRPE
ncbi:MAG: DMT family transporter [Deltaproteobacteria bacterium]|nr:DMT family transporter [Deltaproteobacteria bacterium]